MAVLLNKHFLRSSVVLYGSETCPVKEEDLVRLERKEDKMLATAKTEMLEVFHKKLFNPCKHGKQTLK